MRKTDILFNNFDDIKYATIHEDLHTKNFLNNKKKCWEHFNKYGWREERQNCFKKKNLLDTFLYSTSYNLNSGEILGNNILVISLYDEKKKDRFNELKTVLLLNISNPYLEKIAVLYERNNGLFDDILKNSKIDVYHINQRPSYDDFFEVCNNNYKDKICLVSNSDIIITESLKEINLKEKNEILCLSRYNIIDYEMTSQYFKATYFYIRNHASQDVWIFKSPIKKMDIELLFGTFTCDSFINAYFINQKYKYNNISDKVITLHLQKGRTISQKNTTIRESDVVIINDNQVVKKKDFVSNYINNIRKDRQRLSVCGINNDGEYFYPTGNNNCKNKKIFYNKELKTILWCPGCNECRWDKFFPQYLYNLDIKYAEENSFIIEFKKVSSFKGIENKNVKNIFKIKDSKGNILNFTTNRNTLIFNDVITTDKLFIYYRHLMFFNLELKEFIYTTNMK